MSDTNSNKETGFLVFCIAFVFITLGVLAASYHSAYPKNYEQIVCDDEPDPETCTTIQSWYANAKMPYAIEPTPASCCGVSDAYWVRPTKVTDMGVFAVVEDKREIPKRIKRDGQTIFIPKERLDDRHQDNPTGHSVAFIGTGGSYYVTESSKKNDPQYVKDALPTIYCAFLNFDG